MYKQAFNYVLTVNNTYTIGNFQVQMNELMFKASDHKYLLTFTSSTTVRNKEENRSGRSTEVHSLAYLRLDQVYLIKKLNL